MDKTAIAYSLILALTFANGYMVAWKDGRDTLNEYQDTTVTLGPPDYPGCQHQMRLGDLHDRLTGERTFTYDWFHMHVAWLYLCGADKADHQHRGVKRFCENRDRCT